MTKLFITLVFLICFSLPAAAQTTEPAPYTGTGHLAGFLEKYMVRPSAPVSFANSTRLDRLMRAGRLYLSLQDAIALALENNLDVEFARFNPRLSDTDVLRSQAGQLLRNVGSTSVRSGPPSAGGALAGVSGVSAGGASVSSGSQGGILSGVSVQLAGSAIPNVDPQAYANGQFGHSTQILTNSFATGTNYLTSGYRANNYGVTKGFLTGTSVQLSLSTQHLAQNSPVADFNPSTSGSVGLTVNQHLLQGFGLALNSRVIQIARNNRRSSDLGFQSQVMATVANVVDLYWDLVSYQDMLKVRRQSFELNKKLYEDNRRRAELGAIAPINIIQAEAEMNAAQQDVANAETQVLQQEMILKNVLTRAGVDNLMLVEAPIVPTDTMPAPGQDKVEPIQDLVAEALSARPEMEQSRISLENSRLSMKGTRNALLPTLDVFASATNNGLAGQMNSLAPVGTLDRDALLATRAAGLNPFFLGGFGSVISQLFSRNFPDYAVGFSFNIPLRNRAAQADLIRDQLTYRQQQINDRQSTNNIKVNVINARTALAQARTAYDSALKARALQEQILAGERRKFQLGTSSFLNVVIVQRDTTLRQAAEVQALNTYVRSRTNLESVLGRILKDHNVALDEAYQGAVKRQPDIPVAP